MGRASSTVNIVVCFGSTGKRNRIHAAVVSAGRLDAVFCRWCFYEGIDVVDPDRFPLIVLARLPYLLSRAEFALLEDINVQGRDIR